MKPLVTIIIPMFNEEKNIENCINVLDSQTDTNFEVCFIDDGSTDETLNLLNYNLNKKAQVNYKYSIISQKNSGAASARLKGIEIASTSFVTILDCDDRLSENYIENMNKTIIKNKYVDVLMPNVNMQLANDEYTQFSFYTNDKNLNPLEVLKNSLGEWKVHGWCTIRKSILQISYSEYKKYNSSDMNYINNDEVITRLIFKNASTIVRNDSIYYYNFNPLSTTKKVNLKRYLIIRNALIMKSLFSYNKELKRKALSELISVLWGTQKYLKKNKAKLDNFNDWEKEIKNGISSIKYSEVISHTGFKDKLKLGLLILDV